MFATPTAGSGRYERSPERSRPFYAPRNFAIAKTAATTLAARNFGGPTDDLMSLLAVYKPRQKVRGKSAYSKNDPLSLRYPTGSR